MKLSYGEHSPDIHETAFLASGAKIIGNVKINEHSGIWYNCVLRGDVAMIFVGSNTNIQDCTAVHSSRFNGPTTIGNNVTIGHSAVIHACTIKDFGFIGMHSTIMDKAVVEEYGFVAAGALIPPGKVVQSYQLWAGVPGKHIRNLNDEEIYLINDSWKHYVNLAHTHKKQQ